MALPVRSTVSAYGVRSRAHIHCLCVKGRGAIVSACLLVSTGHGASLITLAVVEPSNACRKRPACVGIMMRSKLSFFASSEICEAGSPESRTRGESASGNSEVRKASNLSFERPCGLRGCLQPVSRKAHTVRKGRVPQGPLT